MPCARDIFTQRILSGHAPGTGAPPPQLSIIVPTKNEADNVEELITRIEQTIVGIPMELIFVDDSSDGTPEVIKKAAEQRRTSISLIHRPLDRAVDGLSGAVVEGMRACLGEWVGVMDADLQHPPELLAAMVERAAATNCDVVIASRYHAGASARGLGTPIRKLVSRAATWLAKALFSERLWPISDPCSGFFLVRADLVKGAGLRPVAFKILIEILMRTSWEKVEEIPYRFGDREGGHSKASVAQGLGFLKHLVRLWFEVPSAGRFWKFALIGASGAVVNLGLLSILAVWMGLSRWLGWAIAVEGSILWNFVLAKNFAWADRPSGGSFRALWSYHTVAAIGLGANALVFASLGLLDAHVLLAGLLGILAGVLINYGGFDRLVFRAAAQPPRKPYSGLAVHPIVISDGELSIGNGRPHQVNGHEGPASSGAGSALERIAVSGGTGARSKESVNRAIQTELKYIPRADPGSMQNALRMLYNFHRRRHLAIDPRASARQALFAAIQALSGESAVFSPVYDAEFFGLLDENSRGHNGKVAP